ncbi:MAG: tetratricopeptide repeat protein [Rhodospirillales bacterium]|nr:tetratricopeptide repeat protein [Rhodospirillales bacterium]
MSRGAVLGNADPFLLSALRFLELGEALRLQGRLAEAKAAYEAALEGAPDSGEAWLGLGLTAEAMNGAQEARRAFAQAVPLLADPTDALLGLASACHSLGKPFAALEAWQAARRHRPTDLRIDNIVWQGFNEVSGEGDGYAGAIAQGNRWRAKERFEEALAAYKRAQALDPDPPFAFSRAGCLLAKMGDYRQAEAEFAEARSRFDWVESGLRLDPAFFDGLPKSQHRFDFLRKAGGEGPIVLIGCDAGYFKRYAERLWRSLCRVEGNAARLHAHLVHPDAECLALAGSFGMGLSVESPELGGRSRNFVNTYYASARFLALPELLGLYGRPLLVMDVDAQILKPLAPLWAVLGESDMAIRRWQGAMVDPWNEPQANLVGVNPTPKGRAFAGSLARFLAHFVAKGQLFGFFDQAALYSVLAADGALTGLKKGAFPQFAYGYPTNRGAALDALSYPSDLLVGEAKAP